MDIKFSNWFGFEDTTAYSIAMSDSLPYMFFLQKQDISIDESPLQVGKTVFEAGKTYNNLGTKKSKNALEIDFRLENTAHGIIYKGLVDDYLLFTFFNGTHEEPVKNHFKENYCACFFTFSLGLDELIVSRTNKTIRVIKL